ncbi:MAG: universal stress protein [Planctomycetota bacterium]
MSAFRRVLVALDFAPSSSRVVEVARELLAPGGALRLLHVVEWVPSVVEGSVAGYGSPRDLRVVHAASLRRLESTARGLDASGVDVEVVEGQPAGAILDAADEWGADLIVVGGRRRGRFTGLRVGGVVERLLRRARCPVIVVPG